MDWFAEWVVCQGDPGNSEYTCNLLLLFFFPCVISFWLILGEEFSWKKSFNKARTIFSLSRQREGLHFCVCIHFILGLIICPSSFSVFISAWPWACSVTSITPGGAHQGRCVLALWERCSSGGGFEEGAGGGGGCEKKRMHHVRFGMDLRLRNNLLFLAFVTTLWMPSLNASCQEKHSSCWSVLVQWHWIYPISHSLPEASFADAF